jgi:hypothetical protein
MDQGQDRAQLFVHDANDFAIIRSGFDEYTLKSVRFRTLRSNVRTSRATATVSSMSANRSRVGHSRRVRAFMLLVFACCWRLMPRSSRLPVPTPSLPLAHGGAVADGTGARWAGAGAAGIEGHVYPATPGEGEAHALVRPILLGMIWFDPLDGNAQSQPPDSEF